MYTGYMQIPWDLNICGFWYPLGSWNQFPLDTQGWLYQAPKSTSLNIKLDALLENDEGLLYTTWWGKAWGNNIPSKGTDSTNSTKFLENEGSVCPVPTKYPVCAWAYWVLSKYLLNEREMTQYRGQS